MQQPLIPADKPARPAALRLLDLLELPAPQTLVLHLQAQESGS